ncbi:ferric iron reductase [Kitasatospora sp. NPDC056446]|uniref:ferric iron reductase n=1 Tax=Kitasatospora sp. NPDC056446 TaxID=3345819 RepID=UPI003683EC56
MILDHAQDLLGTWQYAERYLGGGTRGYSAYSADMDIPDRYHPQRGRRRFTVPTFVVPPGLGVFLPSRLESAVAGLYRAGDAFLLPVHPATLTHGPLPGRDVLRSAERGPDLLVVPSANARTVFVERMGGVPVEPHFVKLHYPRRLSRFVRSLRQPVISAQLWACEEMAAAGLPVLPETGGGVLGTEPDTAWGFLVREFRPRAGNTVGPGHGPPGDGDFAAGPPHYTVPLFALYGHDVRRPDDPTLMEQLIARSTEAAADWLARRVVVPMVRLWLSAARQTGCALELHGQNALFAFDRDGRRTAVLYRDCDVYIDPGIRRARGMNRDLPPANVISRDVHQPPAHMFGLTYDGFMAHHALSRLADVAAGALGVATHRLHRAAREAFAKHGGPTVPLPDTVFGYRDRLRRDGGWQLRDTGVPPEWRMAAGSRRTS